MKRVHQELGGKNPNLILPSADLASSVEKGVKGLMVNSGQTCAAPSRMLVPNSRMEEAKAIAQAVARTIEVGAPDSNAFIGPVVNEAQYQRIQNLIETGIAEGATLVAGGPGRPDGLEAGYFVRPTVFADTAPDMAIVREEIFGPVLVLQGYDMLEDGIRLAVDTDYGLAAYVQGADLEELRSVGDALPAGQVFLNGSGLDLLDQSAPFGGFKKSGNGREWGEFGLEAFLETKAFIGFVPA